MDHRDSSSGQTDGSLSISDGRGHTTSSYTHCHQGMLGCPNFALKKITLRSETLRNRNSFASFRFSFTKPQKKFRFVSRRKFRFVSLQKRFVTEVSI